jgi:preprotein translocase subunit SecA
MAGRGTDIVLGGNLEAELDELGENADPTLRQQIKRDWQQRHDQVLASGGLHIIGTERHESRRIDNQLRGRSGRQGDPGSSRFFLSLEDNLMRIFASDWVQRAMKMLGMKDDDRIEDRLVSKQIEKAQRKVEGHNFDIRKQLLEYDDVANDQRKVIYQQRNELLETESIQDTITGVREDVFSAVVHEHVPPNSVDEQWDLAALERVLEADYGLQLDLQGQLDENEDLNAAQVERQVQESADRMFREKEALTGSEMMRALEKHVMLSVVDSGWKEHLARMDYLRQGIHLRGYAQKQPKQEYKREAFELFTEMLDKVKRDMITLLARVRIRTEEEVAQMEAAERQRQQAMAQRMQFQHADSGGLGADDEAAEATGAAHAGSQPVVNSSPKVGRNDPCPCGSGKKFKHCHGQLA